MSSTKLSINMKLKAYGRFFHLINVFTSVMLKDNYGGSNALSISNFSGYGSFIGSNVIIKLF